MAVKIERISARVRPSIKETIQQAAGLTGSTLNQFLVHSAFEKAQAVIEHERIINLTLKDAQTFFEAVVRPPEPSPKLMDAMKAYKKEFPNAENRGFKSKP